MTNEAEHEEVWLTETGSDELAEQGSIRLQTSDEHVEGEASGVYEYKNYAGTYAQSGTHIEQGQQADSSSAPTTDLQQKPNTNTQTWAPNQEAENVVAKAKISDINIGKRFRKDLGNIDDLVASIRKGTLLSP